MYKRPLLFILLPLCILAITGSYLRFFVTEDYVVEYEIECVPGSVSCFIGTDETTGELYYYSTVRKHAVDVRKECGTDITDCELAQTCNEGNRECSVTFCKTGLGECTIVVPEKSGESQVTGVPEPDASMSQETKL